VDDDYMVEGCVFPGDCCMPGPHYRHECHTPAMIEDQRNACSVRLLARVETWKNRARQQFLCGARTTDNPMGKRLVEHGAMVYANCALELEQDLVELARAVMDEAQGKGQGQAPAPHEGHEKRVDGC
jgi:hypothetical protein